MHFDRHQGATYVCVPCTATRHSETSQHIHLYCFHLVCVLLGAVQVALFKEYEALRDDPTVQHPEKVVLHIAVTCEFVCALATCVGTHVCEYVRMFGYLLPVEVNFASVAMWLSTRGSHVRIRRYTTSCICILVSLFARQEHFCVGGCRPKRCLFSLRR